MTAAPASLAPPDGARAWDLLVIGGGTAGMLAAKTAASFGASVLLVERDRTGGDCLWTGCVPSKALLAAAAAAAHARDAAGLGIIVDAVRVDFAAVMAHVKSAIASIEPDDSPAAIAAAGVRVVRGTAVFTDRASAAVDRTLVPFTRAVIATGSQPWLPPIAGLADAAPLTSDTIWSLTDLPARLAVLGGGSIGCELGQAFARLGSQVTLIEAESRILPREDADAVALVAASLARDGAQIRTGAAVVAVRSGPDGTGELQLADETRAAFDALLVAVGRRPRSRDLGLAAAAVTVDERGYVVVDAHLRTSNRRIWAAGDITGHPQFTHTAGVHGSLAATNAILGVRRRVDTAAMPRVTFTAPEVAAVGLSPAQAQRHPELTIRRVQNNHVDRAVTDGRVDGFASLVLDRKGRLLGATVVGPRAGETLSELVLAVRRGLRARDLAGTVHAYPTYSYGPWQASIEELHASLHRPAARYAVRALARTRRAWTTRRRDRG